MWYKLSDDKTRIENIAPTNKILDDGTIIMNYNLDSERLIADGYIEYSGNKPLSQLKVVDGIITEKTSEDLEEENSNNEKDAKYVDWEKFEEYDSSQYNRIIRDCRK